MVRVILHIIIYVSEGGRAYSMRNAYNNVLFAKLLKYVFRTPDFILLSLLLSIPTLFLPIRRPPQSGLGNMFYLHFTVLFLISYYFRCLFLRQKCCNHHKFIRYVYPYIYFFLVKCKSRIFN